MLLENPASSIKIILSAYVNEQSDIRAFYAVNKKPGQNPVFTPFPGYLNLNSRGQVIAQENNDGRSDRYVQKDSTLAFASENLSYTEYTFTAENLPSFRTYRIKLALTSTSQSFVPRVKELRVIALA